MSAITVDIVLFCLERSKIKSNIINIKKKTEESYNKNENSSQEYAENKIERNTRNITKKGIYTGNNLGKQNLKRTKENIIKGNKKIKEIKQIVKKEKKKQTILYITVTSKSVDDMITRHNINEKQKKQLAELQRSEYNSMWSNVVYGSLIGSTDIVQVALAQVGNIGGQPYWSWYGFNSRVEWCACFVSWCANECGYIKSGIIPKFAGCQTEGVEWFKTCGLWRKKEYKSKK